MDITVPLDDGRIVRVHLSHDGGDTIEYTVSHDYDSITLSNEDVALISKCAMVKLLSLTNPPPISVLNPRCIRIRDRE